jgi:hypothetical protein
LGVATGAGDGDLTLALRFAGDAVERGTERPRAGVGVGPGELSLRRLDGGGPPGVMLAGVEPGAMPRALYGVPGLADVCGSGVCVCLAPFAVILAGVGSSGFAFKRAGRTWPRP